MLPTPKKQPAHIFFKLMYGVVFIIISGFVILSRGQKQKHDFNSITARINSIGRTFPGVFNLYEGKMRYLQVGNYPKAFELFIGHDLGDFSPASEKVDMLKAGDIVTVYYDEAKSRSGDDAIINRMAQFIDKEGQPYYVRGRKDKLGGYVFITTGILIGITLLILRKKETIY